VGCAVAQTHLGRNDLALAALELGYRDHHRMMPVIAGIALLEPLHEEPRFIELVRRMKLPPSLI